MKMVATILDKERIVDVEFQDNTGKVEKNTISIEDFIENILNYNKRLDKECISINCTNLVNIKITGKKIEVLFIIPKFNLMLVHNNKPTIWKLPNMLCECSSNGDLKYWALKGSTKVDSDTSRYHLDLPHHYQGGTVCYGSFARKKVTVDEMLDYAVSYLQTQSSHQLTDNLIEISKDFYKYKIFKDDKCGKVGDLM